jgi:hypothetical protein
VAYHRRFFRSKRQFFVKRFNIKAVALGTLAMLALDLLTGIVLFMLFSGDSLSAGATQDEIVAVAKVIEQDSGFLLLGLLLGTLSMVLGAYLAARLAKHLPLFNACAVGVLGIAAGFVLGGSGESPWWFNAIGYLSTIPAALVGGWLARGAPQPGA